MVIIIIISAGVNFKDSLLSIRNMDSTDDDGDIIYIAYNSKNYFNYTNIFLLMIVPKKIHKDYQWTIATITTMFYHSDSIVKLYLWSMPKGTILSTIIIAILFICFSL